MAWWTVIFQGPTGHCVTRLKGGREEAGGSSQEAAACPGGGGEAGGSGPDGQAQMLSWGWILEVSKLQLHASQPTGRAAETKPGTGRGSGLM